MKNTKKCFIVTIILFAIVQFCNFAIAQNKPEPPKPEPKVQRIAGLNTKFIFALISDGGNGAWIGTEDEGVFHYNANGKITQYTTKNGLRDNNGYALAIDKLGRLWVGHLNKGISVFNGKDWENYDIVDGPIGERIFDIKVCPKDDDIWLATSAGLSRYKIDANKWEHLTREDGLLEDQASTLAFKSDGTLIVGTQCHGLAIFNRNEKGEYKHAQNIVAPERFGPNNCSPVPLTPRGQGLPSNQINDIIVTKNSVSQSIWIATSAGIVKASNDFSKLEYTRGRDYADKVHRLYGGAPKDFKKPLPVVLDQLMPEDYLTSLAEDEIGQIWIGTRRSGFMIMDTISGKRGFGTQKKSGLTDNFVTKILTVKDCNFFVGTYGGGIVKSTQPFNIMSRKPKKPIDEIEVYSVRTKDFRFLPSPVEPSTTDELRVMYDNLRKLRTPLPKNYAAYYGEDWKTRGDWMGRAFHDWAIMCAAVSPFDQHIYFSQRYYSVHEFIGPHYVKSDVIRRWIHWMRSEDGRVLWNPYLGYRRQAEWDDHGEAYPFTHDGPDMWYLLDIKREGVFRVGMYFFNKDGHGGNNRLRDYTIEIYQAKHDWIKDDNPKLINEWRKYSKLAEAQVSEMTPLSKTRVRDFWGGVHKYFVVSGPGKYLVKIDRNYSFNTILSSVMVDRLYGKPTWDERAGIPVLQGIRYEPPPFPKSFERREPRQVMLLWNLLDMGYYKLSGIELQRKYRVAAYVAADRDAKSGDAEQQLANSIKWRFNQWDETQRKEWLDTMKRAWQHFYDTDENLREAVESHKKGFSKILQERLVD
jgi:frataxin-like iron-binding protein CyaY